jgi:hypothetical protein
LPAPQTAILSERRSNADKRRAVEMMLKDAEWRDWTQEKIAAHCAVSIGFVSKMVSEYVSLHGEELKPHLVNRLQDSTRTATRNGTTYTIQTRSVTCGASGITQRSLR